MPSISKLPMDVVLLIASKLSPANRRSLAYSSPSLYKELFPTLDQNPKKRKRSPTALRLRRTSPSGPAKKKQKK